MFSVGIWYFNWHVRHEFSVIPIIAHQVGLGQMFCGWGGPTVGVCHLANTFTVWSRWGWGEANEIRALMTDSDFMFVLQAKKHWMVSDHPSASKGKAPTQPQTGNRSLSHPG